MMMNENDQVVAYYDELAETYDENRFGNSYGQFIDAEERRILDQIFPSEQREARLEIACGTGRLTNYATHGLDASAEMLSIAKKRWDSVSFVQASADDTGFPDESFDAVYTFHLLMHLDVTMIERIIKEVYRILRPGGRFVFDIPSKKRRKLLRHQQESWHGGTALSSREVSQMIGSSFSLSRSFGVMLFPIHKLPDGIRSSLLKLDYSLANGGLKDWSSYLVFELIKQESPETQTE